MKKPVWFSSHAFRQLNEIRKHYGTEASDIYRKTHECLSDKQKNCSINRLSDGSMQLNLEGCGVIFRENDDGYEVLKLVFASWDR